MSSNKEEESDTDNERAAGEKMLPKPTEAGASKKVGMAENLIDIDDMYSEVGNFYLMSEGLQDVEFVVGEQKERIRAVSLPLINQSRVWWSMLSPASPLAEKGDISLPDIEPDVFKLLLKHCYGGGLNLSTLPVETVIKLCYCADKYLMVSLKAKIADALQPENLDQLFPALHCLTFYNLQSLEKAVQQIVQNQTTKLLEHQEFLKCGVESVTYIAKQECLNCDELQLWKAVVAWAKHKAGRDKGPELRQLLLSPLRYIRLLTLDPQELHNHVFALDALSDAEIGSICRKNVSAVNTLCDLAAVREKPAKKLKYRSVSYDVIQKYSNSSEHFTRSYRSCSCIVVKELEIKLQSITVPWYFSENFLKDCREYIFGARSYNSITVTITRITDTTTNTSSDEKPLVIKLPNFQNFHMTRSIIPINTLLQANSKYKIDLEFCNYLPSWKNPSCVQGHKFEHGIFFCSLEYSDLEGLSSTPCHILQFTYEVADQDK